MNYFETDLVRVMTGPVWIVKMMNGRHINIHKSWQWQSSGSSAKLRSLPPIHEVAQTSVTGTMDWQVTEFWMYNTLTLWDEATDEAEDRSGVRVQVLDSDKTKTPSTVALHSSSFLNWTRDSRLREQMARRQEQKVGPLLYSRIRKCVLQLLNDEVFLQ